MNTLISKTGGYSVFAEKLEQDYPSDTTCIRFYTTYDDSKNPEYKQVKLELFLTKDQLLRLKEIL